MRSLFLNPPYIMHLSFLENSETTKMRVVGGIEEKKTEKMCVVWGIEKILNPPHLVRLSTFFFSKHADPSSVRIWTPEPS